MATKQIFTPGTRVLLKYDGHDSEEVVHSVEVGADGLIAYRLQISPKCFSYWPSEYVSEIKQEPKFAVGQDVVFVASPKNLHRVRERRYVNGWQYMMFDGPAFYGEWRLSAAPVVPASQPRFQPGDQVRTPEGDKGTVTNVSTTHSDSGLLSTGTWSTVYTVRRSFRHPGDGACTVREDRYAEHDLEPWAERTFKIGDTVRTPIGAVGTVETVLYDSGPDPTYVVKLTKIYAARYDAGMHSGECFPAARYHQNHSFKASELTLLAPKDCSYPPTLTSRIDDLTERVTALEVQHCR